MKKKQILAYIGISVLLFGGLVFLLSFSYRSVSDKMTIRTRYMMYACGDCHPQHNVKEVLGSNTEHNFLINNDIRIEYASKEQERNINKKVEKCIICYEFYFTGKLKHSKIRGYVFQVHDVRVELPDKNCCS